MKEKINEKYIEKSINPISIESLKIIEEQMINSVCKIHKKNGEKGTGFLCNIPLEEEGKSLPMLITNNHIFNKEDINEGEILISLNNQKLFQKIYLDKKRKIYTDKILDITFIELLNYESKNFKFLEIDKQIYINENFINEVFKNISIYSLNYQNGKNVLVSFGIISEINNNDINHTCVTQSGSSGSPIISLNSHKVIGIHCGNYKNDSLNVGTFIVFGINKFQEKFKQNKKNCDLKKTSINTTTPIKNRLSNRASNSNLYEFLSIKIDKNEKNNKNLNISENIYNKNYTLKNANEKRNEVNKKNLSKSNKKINNSIKNNKKNNRNISRRKSESKSSKNNDKEIIGYYHRNQTPNFRNNNKEIYNQSFYIGLKKPKENEIIKNNNILNKKLKSKILNRKNNLKIKGNISFKNTISNFDTNSSRCNLKKK